jgi:hypothetical protein
MFDLIFAIKNPSVLGGKEGHIGFWIACTAYDTSPKSGCPEVIKGCFSSWLCFQTGSRYPMERVGDFQFCI